MNLKEIEQLVKLVDSSNLTEFELEIENVKILMKKQIEQSFINIQDMPQKSVAVEGNLDSPRDLVKEDKIDDNLHTIKSPIVGVFYKSSSPNKEAYVNIGDSIKKGDVLCIIEAMKLMNEITSDIDGVLEEILISNGDAVEYGQPLFKIRKV